jgi:hypothetical protein
MTEQIRLCLPVRWDGIRSVTALRIRHYDEQGHGGRSSISEKKNHGPFGIIKFFYPNGRWWHIPGNGRARPSGVRVNAIAAGPVLTNGAAPDRIEALGATTLLARPAQPGEIACVIAFLASPKAS